LTLTFACLDDGRIIGFIASRADGIEGEPLLEYVCVDHAYRSRGFGKVLIAHAETTLFGEADNIYLFVSDINARAAKLYESLGYKKVGVLPNYNLYGQTEFLYRKTRRPRQERYLPHTTLTAGQGRKTSSKVIDLNSGYATLALGKELEQCVLEGTRASLAPLGPIDHERKGLQVVAGELMRARPNLYSQIRSTFSGSVALDRVFAAVRRRAIRRGIGGGITAIVPEPSLDLWQILLRERFSLEHYEDVQIRGVRDDGEQGQDRVDLLIERLATEHASMDRKRQLIVLLDSPSNPQGIMTSKAELNRLAQSCNKYGAVLVVDHCFLLAGLHYPKAVATVFDLAPGLCDWIGVWDTGKSIDMAGDKAAFIVPGTADLGEALDESLAVIQPSTSTARRTIEVFTRVLSSEHLPTYLNRAKELCKSNLDWLLENRHPGWEVPKPDGGTFACIYLRNSSRDSLATTEQWFQDGVNVAAGRSFMRSHADELHPFVRVSLFREQLVFQEGIERARRSDDRRCKKSPLL